MAVRVGYLQPIEPHHAETKYTDILLEGWARWASYERGPNGATPAGVVLRIPSVREGRYELRISDDEFTMVDARVAVLAERLREIVDLEYRGYWRGRHWTLTQEEKWNRIGLRRLPYRERLTAAQWTLYTLLLPHVAAWFKRVV